MLGMAIIQKYAVSLQINVILVGGWVWMITEWKEQQKGARV